MNISYKLLLDLVHTQAVSGEEYVIFSYIKNFLRNHKISFKTLKHGDIVVGNMKSKLLITAHVDEVGFQIDKIHDNGICSIKDIGWVYPWLFHGREVQIQTKNGKIIYGLVIYDKAFDIKIDSWKKIKVDFGFDSVQENKKNGIISGLFGTYKKSYWETENRVFASALDNRLSVAMLLDFIVKNPQCLDEGVAFAFTSDEEMENEGAKKTIPYVNPEYVCVVDIMPHSLLENAKKLDLKDGPYILDKTLDYQMPKSWKNILKDVHYQPLRGKSEYLKNSEPKIFQRKGYENSINFLTIMANYHHGVYSCHTEAIEKSYNALEEIVKKFYV